MVKYVYDAWGVCDTIVLLAEISGTNSAINSLGKTVEFTWGINSGIGANFNIGPKTSFGLSFGVGITFSFEVK